MTSMTLIRREDSRQRLNLNGLVPDRLLHLSESQIDAWPIGTGSGTSVPLASQFTFREGARDRLLLRGKLDDCDFVAGEMLAGDLYVEGSVGDRLADGMRGGRVVVAGNAGNYACCSLRGGQVEVQGDVGRYAAGAAPNATRGMAGGELLIGGSADQFLATRMRRGRIIVLGDVAAGCASRMIAGTIVVCGNIQLPMGYGMSRGTILLLRPPLQLIVDGLPGFTELQFSELSFLALLLKDIASHLPDAAAQELARGRWLRAVGDRGTGGQGEVFARQLNSPYPEGPWQERELHV